VGRKRLSCCRETCNHGGGQDSLGGASARHWKAHLVEVDSRTSASLTFAAVERETCLVEIEDVLELLGLDLNLARLLISVLDIAFGVTLISSVNIMSYIVSSPSWPMLLA
jgi:hypothetical protein